MIQRIFEALQAFAISCEFAIAGFIGGVAGALVGDRKTKRDFIVFVFAGTACAHFLTALVSSFFHIEPARAGGIGFLIGAVSGSLIAAVIRAGDQADLWPFIREQLARLFDTLIDRIRNKEASK